MGEEPYIGGEPDPGLLLERGITIRKGHRHAEATLAAVLQDVEINLSGTLRFMLAQLLSELRQLTGQIVEIDQTIQCGADEQEVCQWLMAIPRVGPITATAIVAAIGNGAEFRKARSFSAWLGLVLGEYTTGGKQKLLGISKRESLYLRPSAGAWRTSDPAVPREAISWYERLAGQTDLASPS